MADTAPTVADTLGARIREARKAAGYRNVETLAVELGVGQRTLQRWETGKSEPSIRQLLEIADRTGHPLAHFVSANDGAAA